MGIPSFYSWLLQQYPEIKISCKGDHSNGIKCDNLYLDMNQIIHKCAESNDENEIIKRVFDHIDRILSIIRPCQLLYMAIDGVTPRARMTHQRTNRFLKSKNISDGIKEKFLTNDRHQKVTADTFDECNIKPGTKFMTKLSKCLQDYICCLMKRTPAWNSLKIILSDANVPGEGEHKIIDFIRQQRILSGSDSNTYNVVYGSDSELVLLECGVCRNIGHGAKDCDTNKDRQNNKSSLTTAKHMEMKYVFIDLSKLRDCLECQLQKHNLLSFQRKPERSIDDWVFICLLFGNDFLPKSPSIHFFGNYITMDHLIDVYQKNVEENKGYLTENDTINMNRLITFLKKIGEKDLDGKLRRPLYYKDKFNVNETQLGRFSIEVATNYVRGLCWVFQYYYRGPPSWNWYYPHYYAPLAYDFTNLKNVPLNFDQNTKPFRPFEQMMATFSSQNAKYLPREWQPLMLNENSPILKFYPQNFYVDPNGRQKSSQYVALIPFIDENLLFQALESVYSTLTQEEEKHNTLDYDRLFIHSRSLYYQKFQELTGNGQQQITENNPIQLHKILNGRLVGDIWPDDNNDIINVDNGDEALLSDYRNISDNQVIRFKYRDSLFRNESVEIQTASNPFNLVSTAQSQQQQALPSKQVHKPSPWGKPS